MSYWQKKYGSLNKLSGGMINNKGYLQYQNPFLGKWRGVKNLFSKSFRRNAIKKYFDPPYKKKYSGNKIHKNFYRKNYYPVRKLQPRKNIYIGGYQKKLMGEKNYNRFYKYETPFDVKFQTSAPYYENMILNNMQAGTGESERLGLEINAQKLFINGIVDFSNCTTAAMVRIMIVIDNSSTLLDTPLISKILRNCVDNDSAMISDYWYTKYPNRFKILVDKTFVQDATSATSELQTFKWNFNLNNLKLRYVSSAVDNWGMPSLWIVYFSDVDADWPKLSFQSLLTYYG